MKKIISALLAAFLVLGLAGCDHLQGRQESQQFYLFYICLLYTSIGKPGQGRNIKQVVGGVIFFNIPLFFGYLLFESSIFQIIPK